MIKRSMVLAIVAPLVALIFVVGSAAGLGQYIGGTNGVDVSYPNCSVSLPKVAFGVVGVNHGVVYSTNECLKAQASAFSNLSLYLNTGLNASSTSTYYQTASANCNGNVSCAAYNYGYNYAVNAVNYASSQGVHSATWWLDAETSNTWNSDVAQNQRSLQGAHDALSANGATTIGVYSTTAQWNTITGGWKNGWPSWGATTWTTAKQAAGYCTGHEFTGGPSLLMQYKSKQSKLDQDYAC
jgi:hypothetical protein